jgi:hypothetical protein
MASPCGFPVSSWYHPPLRSRHPSSYSSSAATWTSCDQPQQHATHPRPHSSLKDLRESTHVFLRQDAIRRALEPPYSGPQKVIARTDKILKIDVRGRQVTVSTDRINSAYILEGTQHDNGSPQAEPSSAPTKPVTPTQSPRTTRSGRTVRFPVRFTT